MPDKLRTSAHALRALCGKFCREKLAGAAKPAERSRRSRALS
jgi:hypothetical protein